MRLPSIKNVTYKIQFNIKIITMRFLKQKVGEKGLKYWNWKVSGNVLIKKKRVYLRNKFSLH